MDNMCPSKKTMGRRKFEKKTNPQVAFCNSRLGLFRKAGELSVLCGSNTAILVQSPADKIFGFGIPSVESALHRFRTGDNLGTSSGPTLGPTLSLVKTAMLSTRKRLEEIEKVKLDDLSDLFDFPLEFNDSPF
ncbi:hypothetical protein CDL12_18838 [Handroanthus impetiginosus]|uniref:MADS-box domain-containing protein n=1 Tax=Handroanthus impetiginosus TaxID=429701 RepID=A0A2G9GTJ8_9LAMI|nr:hypothetical protein CDL12_18838 [Handroanthus impetiginosus]